MESTSSLMLLFCLQEGVALLEEIIMGLGEQNEAEGGS